MLSFREGFRASHAARTSKHRRQHCCPLPTKRDYMRTGCVCLPPRCPALFFQTVTAKAVYSHRHPWLRAGSDYCSVRLREHFYVFWRVLARPRNWPHRGDMLPLLLQMPTIYTSIPMHHGHGPTEKRGPREGCDLRKAATGNSGTKGNDEY